MFANFSEFPRKVELKDKQKFPVIPLSPCEVCSITWLIQINKSKFNLHRMSTQLRHIQKHGSSNQLLA